jgi:16S rRNA (adenine1518-N6/adenine1519-N6)-dimethyltransferase
LAKVVFSTNRSAGLRPGSFQHLQPTRRVGDRRSDDAVYGGVARFPNQIFLIWVYLRPVVVYFAGMKLSEMRELLDQRGIQLTKSLGQNFLHDAHQLERMVGLAELTTADKVLEIGPGLGPLTEFLLAKAAEVLAIEKDARLVEVLSQRFATQITIPHSALGTPHLELLHADALDFLKHEARDWRDWKLVANLPYSVASPILVELAAGARAPRLLVVTLQLEVAQRLMAQADGDDYGLLTLLVGLDFEPRGWFKIPAGSFFPAPDVDSACVRFVRREQPLLPENLRSLFMRLVKRSFSQRRKMMLKLLKQDWPKEKLEAAFAELNISPQERAEKLSLDQFVALTEILAKSK